MGTQTVALDAGQFYTVRNVSGSTFQLALTDNPSDTVLDLTSIGTGNLNIRRVASLVSLEGATRSEILAGRDTSGNLVSTLAVVSSQDATVDITGNSLHIIEGSRVLDHEENLSLGSFISSRVDGLQGVSSVVTTSAGDQPYVFAAEPWTPSQPIQVRLARSRCS